MPLQIPLERFSPDRPPVVVLGGINLVRAAGLAGLPVIAVVADADEPGLGSRYCTAGVAVPGLEARAEYLVALGQRLHDRLGRRVPLMYGSDEALGLIHEHRAALERHFAFLLCDADVAESLIAKDRFQSFAAQRGLPVPRGLSYDGDGPDGLRQVAGPVVVKPREKAEWHHSALCQRLFGGDAKALVFESGRAAYENPDIALFHEQLAFQDYVPGDDTCLYSFHGFADENGDVLASFVGRKIRTFPAGNGESAFIELAHAPELEALGREVARRCPLKGVFKMDVKRDPRDGSWWLLEVNARYTLWNYLGAMNGVNLASVAYDYLLHGERPAATRHGTRYRWLSLSLDYKAFRELKGRGELGTAAWLASIVFSRNLHDLFAWHDPMPSVRHWAARAGRLARKVLRAPARLATR